MIDFNNLECLGGCGSGWGFFVILGLVSLVMFLFIILSLLVLKFRKETSSD